MHLWPALAWQEIKLRYRRSVLGPFWLTISATLFIAGLGPLYGALMKQDLAGYIHYLAVGFIVWQFISALITEGCQTFIAAEGFVKQTSLPLSVHAMRVVWRNTLIFAHNCLILAAVSLYFSPPWDWGLISSLAGALLIALNGFWASVLLGLLSTRFRDIPQIIASLVQLLFFLTPVFWRPDMIERHQWVSDWNPMFHFIEIVRAPLLGHALPGHSWLIAATVTIAGWMVMLGFFARYRARIAYWL